MLSNDYLKEDNFFTLRGGTQTHTNNTLIAQNEKETDLFSKLGVDSMRSQFSCYDKEREEEIENKNLFAYELYENTDLLSEDEARNYNYDDRCSSGYNSKRGKQDRVSFSSTKNLVSKKTTSNTHSERNNRERDVELGNALRQLNIVNLDRVGDQPGRNYKLIENVRSKENLLRQILAMNFTNEQKSKSVSTTFSRRPKSSEASRVMYGERLYHKGLALKERSSKNLNSIRAQRTYNEMRECTFTPKLNNTSILCNLKSTYSCSDPHSRYKPRPKVISFLSRDTSNLNSQLSSMRTTEAFDIHKVANRSGRVNATHHTYNDRDKDNITMLKDSKFITTSNFNSKTYDSLKSKKKTTDELIQHSNKLFNDAEKIRVTKEKMVKNFYSESCPFQPNIIDKNKPNVYNFFYRLQRWVDKRNEKYDYDLEKINYDNKTGLRLFSPQINSNTSLSNVTLLIFNSFSNLD